MSTSTQSKPSMAIDHFSPLLYRESLYLRKLIDCMVFYSLFDIISVITRQPVQSSMLSFLPVLCMVFFPILWLTTIINLQKEIGRARD